MTIAYDAGDLNELTVLFRWHGTIIPKVLCRPVLWLLVASHVGFLYMHMYRDDITLPTLPWKLTAVPTALLTFFIVFYSSNCYNRYYTFYSKCTGMSAAVMCWVGLLRVHFPKASPEILWNLCRHMVASVYMLYFQLAGGASDGGKQVTESEWQVLLQTGLLSPEEKKKLAEYRGFKPFLLQVWAMRALSDHIAVDKDKGPNANLGPFQTQALAARGCCADIVNTMTQPVPFPYYHTLTLMLSLNLLMISYSLLEFETTMTVPVFFIIVFVLLGLKETAVVLADPFGGNDVDFETEVYMANMLANSKALISPSADYVPQTLPLAVVKASPTKK
ncbi:hypothetical protein Ctob_002466 [Chrysochromulina tobinii]|uniref:Bestrophin homolog n=1 Tax=Chrysochromulina tobinii TaxID=1460289 RepID=A0A0M0JKC5_9EUKA|nr:hypothetical protein Ctob_002466 [Chrysochromulina tobinii]|eukprot:KOO27009.1 hypothetical protein Ctob_002466 [Chrysochromulina sp. CCMP291]